MTPACYYLVVDAGALFHELGNWGQVIKHVNACLQANAATKNFRVETATVGRGWRGPVWWRHKRLRNSSIRSQCPTEQHTTTTFCCRAKKKSFRARPSIKRNTYAIRIYYTITILKILDHYWTCVINGVPVRLAKFYTFTKLLIDQFTLVVFDLH